MRWRNTSLAVLVLVAALAAGCSKTAVVKGRVTLDGKPVAGATVLFVPDAPDRGRPASAQTDNDGNFRLMTYRLEDGAVPGAYRIVVSKTEAAPAPDPHHTGKKGSIDRLARNAARQNAKRLIPAVYGDEAKTPLRCTVPAPDTVKVELVSKPPG
jgi:hypothetical protein